MSNFNSFFLEIILKLFIHQKQWMLHPISLSFSFSTMCPPPRCAWIKTPGNIRGPGAIGLSPRTRVLLQNFKTSRQHPISLSFSFSTMCPPPRCAWIKTPGNIRGPGAIGLSPRTRVLLQNFKTSRQHPISLSFSFSTMCPPPRCAWIKTPGNIRGPGAIGLSPRTRVLLQNFKTSRQHPISLSFSFSTMCPPPRCAWIKTPGNIRGPGAIGLSPRTRVLLQNFKTSRQHPISLSFSFSTMCPPPRCAWIKTPGNIRGPGAIGLSPRTRVLLQNFKTSRQHPISLSFSFSTVRPPPRSAWIKTPGNIRGPGAIGLSPRTRVLLQDFKTSSIHCSWWMIQ